LNLLFHVFTDQLDLSLIGWVLLLLSRSLDSIRLPNSDDVSSSKEREGNVKLDEPELGLYKIHVSWSVSQL